MIHLHNEEHLHFYDEQILQERQVIDGGSGARGLLLTRTITVLRYYAKWGRLVAAWIATTAAAAEMWMKVKSGCQK